MSGAASAALPPVTDGGTEAAVAQASASSMLGMYKRLEQLQREVQQLRGQVEEQTYRIEALKKRQRDLYLDIDRRIAQLKTSKKVILTSTNDSNSVVDAAKGIIYQPISTTTEQDKLVYDKALLSLKAGRYQQSISDFSSFVKSFPNSVYFPNALYWLGEASYVNRDFKRALEEFNKLISQHATHVKAKGALLKIGFIQYEIKQWEQSRKTLIKVTTSYPGTTVAGLAQKRLDRLRQEKH